MARFCPNCGTPAEEGSAFCMECGTPIPQDEAAPFAASAAEEAFAAAPAKPMSKRTKLILIIAASVAVVLFAVSKIFGGIYSTNSVSERFLKALEEGDFAALSKAAVVADDTIVLTEENTKPLFTLIEKSPAALETYAEMLETNAQLAEDGEDQYASYPLTFNVSNWVLFKTYEVCINPCTVQVETNLVGADVTVGGITAASVKGYAGETDGGFSFGNSASDSAAASDSGESSVIYMDDYGNTQTAVATIAGLLPGLYDVECSYTTSLGEVLHVTDTVRVDERSVIQYTSIPYAMSSVYNPYDYEVEVSAAGSSFTLQPYSTLNLSPISGNLDVVISCSPNGAATFEDSYNVAEESYHDVYFESSSVRVYNDYYSTITAVVTTASGKSYDAAVVSPDSSETAYLVPVGSTVSAVISDDSGIEVPAVESTAMPVEYADSYRFDPYFYLNAEGTTTFTQYFNDYVVTLHQAAANGADAFGGITGPSDLIGFFSGYVASSWQNYEITTAVTFPDAQIGLQYRYNNGSYVACVCPEYTINLTLTASDGTTYNETYTFNGGYFYFYNGNWNSGLPE